MRAFGAPVGLAAALAIALLGASAPLGAAATKGVGVVVLSQLLTPPLGFSPPVLALANLIAR